MLTAETSNISPQRTTEPSPLAWLARRLEPEKSRLDELSFGGESVRAAFAQAIGGIEDPLVTAAFRLLDRLVDLGLAEWGDDDTELSSEWMAVC